MKASFPLILASAIALFAGVPFAQAFQIQGNGGPPASPDPATNPDDPDYARQNLSDREAATRGMTSLGTTRLGNTTIHFGASRPGMLEGNSNNLFLDNPAARSVPSQR
jgi:hypothetical protein